MRYYVLLFLVVAGSFAAASVVCAALVAGLWGRVRETLPAAAARRAWLLATIRLAPLGAGLLSAGTITLIFFRYEPRDTTENPGLLLLFAAIVSLVLTAMAAVRVWSAGVAARECRALLQACGRQHTRSGGPAMWVLDTEYPVAAVMGLLRVRLLLSRRILAECTEAEVASVIRHELAHIARRDNLVQAAMRFLPDPLAHTRTGRAIQDAWAQAAEEAADDLAAVGPQARTDLAAALVRVAGMAGNRPPGWMPALAFFERRTVESRVRRLLAGDPGAEPSLAWIPAALTLLVTVVVLSSETVGLRLHALMELAVQVLP